MPEQQVEFRKFIPFVKVDEGTHTVYGLATSETVDCDNEIADYEGSKQAFEKWSKSFLDRTTAAGQEPSLGCIRIQHGLEIGGKVTRIDFKDTEKQVWLATTPVNDEVWEMVKNGFLTGYSIGGKVYKRKKEGDYVRYWYDLSETSYVDNPAVPDAVFAYVKSDGSVELRKFRATPESIADRAAANAKSAAKQFSAVLTASDLWEGAPNSSMSAPNNPLFSPAQLEQIRTVVLKSEGKTKRVAGEDLGPSAFAFVGSKDDPSTWKLPLHFSSEEKSKRHTQNALARFNQTKGIPEDEKAGVHAKIVAAAKKYGIDVADEEKKSQALYDLVKASLTKSISDGDLKKSMYQIGTLAEVLSALSYLYSSCLMEAIWEEDDRDDALAVELAAAVQHLVQILKDMVEEETSELIPALKAAQDELKLIKGENMDPEVIDVAQELADLAKAGHSLKAHFKKMASHHEKMAGHHEKMAAHHESLMACHKDMEEAHKACMGAKAEDAMHGFHKSGMASCKAASSEHGGLHKAHTKLMEAHKAASEHCKAMSEHHDEGGLPEGDKAAKAAADKLAADKAAQEVIEKAAADKLIADKAAADAAAKAAGAPADPNATLVLALTDLKKSFETGLTDMRKDLTDALAVTRPTGTQAIPVKPGIELINRGKPNGLAKAGTADDLGI